MKEQGYEFLEHTADIQVHSWGKTIEEAFSQTAYSLIASISPDLKKISQVVEKKVIVQAEDKEALLFDFLSEFLFIFDVEGLIFNEIKVLFVKEFNGRYELEAQMKGEIFDKNKHEIGVEVKAITYSFMELNESKDGVDIMIVFDI